MILVIGTEQNSGKGGISSAASGFSSIMESAGMKFNYLNSHRPDNNKQTNFLLFFQVLASVLYYRIYAFINRESFKIYMHVGPKGSLVRKLLIALFGRFIGSTVIAHHHSPAFKEYLENGGLMGISLKYLFKLSNKNFVLTDWWKTLYSQHGLIDAIVVPNCVDIPELNSKRPSGKNLLSMGRLVKEKNVELVISALSFLPAEYKLTIAGDGPYRKALEHLAIESKVEGRVCFLGWVDSAEKYRLLSQSNLFVLPTLYDSFGMVFAEALSTGCPVIYGDHPAVCSSVGDLYGAYSSSTNNAKDVAEKIKNICSLSHDERRIVDSVSSVYSMTAVTASFIQKIES